MALIKCTECGREVSEKASTCPHCGNTLAQTEEEEEELKRNVGVRIVCDITTFLGLLFVGGFAIPLLWSIGFKMYSSATDENVNDVEWYRKLSRENLLSAFLVLFLNAFLFFVLGRTSVFGIIFSWIMALAG